MEVHLTCHCLSVFKKAGSWSGLSVSKVMSFRWGEGVHRFLRTSGALHLCSSILEPCEDKSSQGS